MSMPLPQGCGLVALLQLGLDFLWNLTETGNHDVTDGFSKTFFTTF
jgi:hypothetical protein